MSSEVVAADNAAPTAPAASPVRVEGLVRLRGGDKSLPPLFMCPDVTGDVLTTIRLSRLLPGSRPVQGLRALTHPDGAAVDLTVPEMAASLVERIRAVQPTGDYTLLGYSFGANLAYEAARLLEQAGHRVRVAMLDPYVSNRALDGVAKWRYHLLVRPWSILGWLIRSSWTTRRRFGHRLVHRFAPWTGVGPPPPEGQPNTEQENRMAVVGTAAHDSYRPGRLSSPTLIVATRERWADMCDPIPLLLGAIDDGMGEVVWMDGTHEEMVLEPHVQETVAILDRWLHLSVPAAG